MLHTNPASDTYHKIIVTFVEQTVTERERRNAVSEEYKVEILGREIV